MEPKYKWIFALLLITNILINLDHGIIPAGFHFRIIELSQYQN